MSGAALVGLVLDNFKIGRASVKLVLVALAEHANGFGECYPSRARIAARADCSTATAGRALRQLERGGWIQRRQRFNTSSEFRINVARLRALDADRRKAEAEEKAPGWEPFPEEIAAQVIENKGDDHCDQGSDHSCDQGSDHSGDQLTFTEPALNGGLREFERTRIREGKPLVLRNGGGLRALSPGSPEFQRLAQVVRAGDLAEKSEDRSEAHG